MSNEEQMRKEFEEDAQPYGFDVTRSECKCGSCFYENEHTNNRWFGWAAAYEMLQSEADALNRQVLELSAQIEVMMNPRRWTKEMHDAWHQNVPDMQKAFEALRKASIPPSSALLAHDNEVAAKALEDAAERFHEIAEENDSVKFHMELLRIAEERRNRK